MGTSTASTPPSGPPYTGRRMLICSDLSATAETCIPAAISLAKTFGSAVTLLHVMQPRQERSGPQASDALGCELSRQQARAYLNRLEAKISKALDRAVDVRIEQGQPAERIVDVARELDADLTVLASRREGPVPAWTLGETAQRVLASLRSSVFIAHSPSLAVSHAPPKCILVPLDGSFRSESVLPTVARIALAHGSEILLAHVVQDPLPTALLGAPEDMELALELAGRLETSAAAYLRRLQLQLSSDAPAVRTRVVRHVSERRCLLELSQREDAGLVVLSAHGSACDSARSFGSVTVFFLTHSEIPLLVLQDLPTMALHRGQEVDAKLPPAALRASYVAGNSAGTCELHLRLCRCAEALTLTAE